MKVGDVIRHTGEKYTIVCFYAPVFKNGIEDTEVVYTSYSDIQHLPFVKVTAVRHYEGYNRYVHIPIENVTPIRSYIKEFQEADGLWSAFRIALKFPTTSHNLIPLEEEYTQADYDGQHVEEVPLWLDSDLVPNPR